MKIVKNACDNVLKLFKYLALSNQQSKTRNIQIIITENKENRNRECLSVLLRKLLIHLFYWNSCAVKT